LLANSASVGDTPGMNPERLARTVFSMTFAAMAGAILGLIPGIILIRGNIFYAVVPWPCDALCIPTGAVIGAVVGWKWGKSAPLTGRPCDQEADYGDDPRPTDQTGA
jgi:hypothetical protein